MIIQTIQPLSVWEDLQRDHIVFSRPNYDEYGGLSHSWNFKTAYGYMKKKMIEKGISPQQEECDIFWGWAWAGDRDKKEVDLRTRRHTLRSPHVLLTLEKNQCLLSNFHLWHYVLNYWLIVTSQTEEKKWDRLCKKSSHNYYQHKPLAFIHDTLEASWEYIFMLKQIDKDYYIDVEKKILDYWQMHEKQVVQATYWNIQLSEVLKVQPIALSRLTPDA